MANSTNYVVEHTDPSKSNLTITAGTVNGPNGGFGGRNTDLDLMGSGYLDWGDLINQNYLHLLENFSCPSDIYSIVSIATANHFTIEGNALKSFEPEPILEIDSLEIKVISLTGGAGNNYFLIPGNFVYLFPADQTFSVSGSSNANGTWTTVNNAGVGATYVAPNTIIPVQEALPVNANVGTLGHIDAGNYIKLSGNLTSTYVPGFVFNIYGTTGFTYDQAYTVSSDNSSYAAPYTYVPLEETIPAAAFVDGTTSVVTQFNIVDSPGVSGYQTVLFSPGITGTTLTGLAGITYTVTITIDSVFIQLINFIGTLATTFDDLISVLNNQLSGHATAAIDTGNIVITSATGGTSSSVVDISVDDLFLHLPSFSTIDTAVSGIDNTGNNGVYTATNQTFFDGSNTQVYVSPSLVTTTPTTLGSAGNPDRPNQNLSYSPVTPVEGQLWYNSTTDVMHTYNGEKWSTISTGGLSSIGIVGSIGLTVSGSPITTNGTIALTLNSRLQNLSGLSTTGMVAYNSGSSFVSRTITGDSETTIHVANGDGVSGDPTINVITGNLSETGSSVLTITGGTDAVVSSDTTIQVKQATTTQAGYLSSADWNTFNNKQNAIVFPMVTGLGGTGFAGGYSNGQLLIGNSGGNLSRSTLTAGSGITISNGSGSITISAAAGGYPPAVSNTPNTLALRDSGGYLQSSTPSGFATDNYVITRTYYYNLTFATGQTWQNPTRAFWPAYYQNSTQRPIQINVSFYQSNALLEVAPNVGGTYGTWVTVGWHGLPSTSWQTVSAVVPPGWFYRAVNGSSSSINGWAELR